MIYTINLITLASVIVWAFMATVVAVMFYVDRRRAEKLSEHYRTKWAEATLVRYRTGPRRDEGDS